MISADARILDTMKALAVAAVTALSAYALNNGVGLLPELGINTWYMTHSQ